jgi:endonuclease YncB( thermonuclease family)
VVPTAGDTTTARVTKIVDGDTIRTTKGTIRLVGIDTPERGRCNAAKATAKTRKLVPVGSRVTLTRPAGNNNKDRYGRYLRYVSRNGVDVGGALIKAGLADARYDSLDGYPRHAKQARYRAWDARYPDKRCTGTSSGTGASDTYTGCRAYGPDGTSVDDRGRRYTKIDCTTKKPL